MIKQILIDKLSASSKRKLRNIRNDIKSLGRGRNLNTLGEIYGSDKSIGHYYTKDYMTHFKAFKYKRIKLLEIGVGGYDNPNLGGESLRMWKKYFPFGLIFSIDIFDKSLLQENRVKIFKGSQRDNFFLTEVINEIGEPDLIIDDGSHINEDVIETFELLFPKLKDGGIYVVEDTQTSYWKRFGGDSDNLNNPRTMMNYFKRLTDGLNNKEFVTPNYVQSYFDKKIISIHFYHNLIFVYKGNNNNKSNVVIDNQPSAFVNG